MRTKIIEIWNSSHRGEKVVGVATFLLVIAAITVIVVTSLPSKAEVIVMKKKAAKIEEWKDSIHYHVPPSKDIAKILCEKCNMTRVGNDNHFYNRDKRSVSGPKITFEEY